MKAKQLIELLDISEHTIEMMIDKSIDYIATRVKSSSLSEQLDFLYDNRIDIHRVYEWLDIETTYYEKIMEMIGKIDHNANVSDIFLTKAYADKVHPMLAVESFFNDTSFDVTGLKGLAGTCDSFHKEVCKPQRPYIAISDEAYDVLLKQEYDYYITSGGTVVSFGDASVEGGKSKYALMPLNEDETAKLKVKNRELLAKNNL